MVIGTARWLLLSLFASFSVASWCAEGDGEILFDFKFPDKAWSEQRNKNENKNEYACPVITMCINLYM